MIRNPFPGPLPYRRADRACFFGRDQESRDLVESIFTRRCVTLYGPNGAGKSSLLQASVIPTLIDKRDISVVSVDGWPEGQSPARWLASAMYRDLGFGQPPAEMSANEAILMAARRTARRSERLALLHLDQIEQLFYAGRNEAEINNFFISLYMLVGSSLRNVRLLLTLREAYLGRFFHRMRDSEWTLEHCVRLNPLTVSQLTAAVCQSAAQGDPPQTWSVQELRPLIIQLRAQGQPATDDAEVQSLPAQLVCRSRFQQLARGPLAVDGPVSRIFRRDNELGEPSPSESALQQLPPDLKTLLRQPFTLVLADFDENRTALFHNLTQLMRANGEEPEGGTSFYTLFQWCLQRYGQPILHRLLQQYLMTPQMSPPLPLVGAIARFVPPGIHLSALWAPQLPRVLAERQPMRNLYTILPSLMNASDPPHTLKRPAGTTQWNVEPHLPDSFDLDHDIVLLGLYGGFSSRAFPHFSEPLLTEDGTIRDIVSADGILTPPWMTRLLMQPKTRPSLFIGMSVLDWRHRMLLRWLYDQGPAPPNSLALLNPSIDIDEAELWNRGAGLPGTQSIASITEHPAHLAALLNALTFEASPP